MIKVSKKKFEQMVSEGISAIPEVFLKKLDNVVVVVEPEPTVLQKRNLHIYQGLALFGLFEGVPQAKRGSYYSSLPDKITIFQKPIEMSAINEEDMKEIVKNTVWHEIAHHFGMDESEVRRAEEKRRRR
jgi:predicted Zn-dependent protease with MMP-like domain